MYRAEVTLRQMRYLPRWISVMLSKNIFVMLDQIMFYCVAIWRRATLQLPCVATSGVRRKFSWGGSFSSILWSFVFGVHCLWRHNLTSYSCYESNVSAKFLDIVCIFSYRGDEPICYRGPLCQLPLSERVAQLFSHTMKPVTSRLLVSPECFAGRIFVTPVLRALPLFYVSFHWI